MKEVIVTIAVDYGGTTIAKTIAVRQSSQMESPATLVNRGLELVTKKIQIMVQSEQGVT